MNFISYVPFLAKESSMKHNLERGLTFRDATANDALEIAELHARSWQLHYRGMLPDEFLNHQVNEDRKKVWTARFVKNNPNQYVLLAINKRNLVGFVCAFLDHDPRYGTLIDNLHVIPEYQKSGIGRRLMHYCAKWCMSKKKKSPIFLFVLTGNKNAIAFYKRLGAQISEPFEIKAHSHGPENVHRCHWPNGEELVMP